MSACMSSGFKMFKIGRGLRDFGDPAASSTFPRCGSRLEPRNGGVSARITSGYGDLGPP